MQRAENNISFHCTLTNIGTIIEHSFVWSSHILHYREGQIMLIEPLNSTLVSLHPRINLSPFTKDFRGEEHYNESIDLFFKSCMIAGRSS